MPTPRSEVGGSGIEASWAGGARGREVLDRLLPRVGGLLSARGAFYLVVVDENDPRDIARVLAAQGLAATTLASRRARPRPPRRRLFLPAAFFFYVPRARAGNERLSILRFARPDDATAAGAR